MFFHLIVSDLDPHHLTLGLDRTICTKAKLTILGQKRLFLKLQHARLVLLLPFDLFMQYTSLYRNMFVSWSFREKKFEASLTLFYVISSKHIDIFC